MTFIHDDFLLTNDYAVELFHEFARDEPILDFHNHLSPKEIAEDRSFNNLSEIWLEGDHYKWRALRANGIPEELVTGNGDAKEKYLAWAATLPHTLGNPLYHWTHLELKRCFDIDLLLSPTTAEEIWECANEKLREPKFSARGMLKRFQVKALCTTDDPAHPLHYHEAITQGGCESAVFPTFRPDQSWGIDQADNFIKWIETLEETSGKNISSFNGFLQALADRLQKFHELGSRLSDHSFPYFFADFPSEAEARQLFDQTLNGQDATNK